MRNAIFKTTLVAASIFMYGLSYGQTNQTTVSNDSLAAVQLSKCPLAGTPDCPLVKCPLWGTPDCPYTMAAGKQGTSKDLPACCMQHQASKSKKQKRVH
ncbi:MAG TPA: hypothetical protein VNJ07_07980 [Chitinophagales bacterium]|nr:hypothetical protein [Chitinophagales bacterium]